MYIYMIHVSPPALLCSHVATPLTRAQQRDETAEHFLGDKNLVQTPKSQLNIYFSKVSSIFISQKSAL